MQTVIGLTAEFLSHMLFALPLAFFIRAIASLRLKKLGMYTNKRHEILCALFIMYCAGLASMTLLYDGALSFSVGEWRCNLIPFRFIYELICGCYRDNGVSGAVNILGNIAVFVPLGFCVSILWRNPKVCKAAAVSAAASVFIELCQLPQTARVSDIDDIILNTLGGLAGYILYLPFKNTVAEKYHVIKPEEFL